MIIAHMLRNARAKWPEKTALWFGEQAWTFAVLDDQSAALARGLLAAGVECGDRVAVAMPKGVVDSQGGLAANGDIQVETFAFTADDVHLISTAACHAAAFTGQLLPGLASGGCCVLTHLPRPDRVVQEIVRRRVSRVQM